jgi:hypothetical protein
MTSLAKRKSRLRFTTCDTVRERRKLREVVIDAHSHYCDVRLAGLRTSYPISYAAIYTAAVKIAVEKMRAERRERKKAQR